MLRLAVLRWYVPCPVLGDPEDEDKFPSSHVLLDINPWWILTIFLVCSVLPDSLAHVARALPRFLLRLQRQGIHALLAVLLHIRARGPPAARGVISRHRPRHQEDAVDPVLSGATEKEENGEGRRDVDFKGPLRNIWTI